MKLYITIFPDGTKNISAEDWGKEGFILQPEQRFGLGKPYEPKADQVEVMTTDVTREEWLRNVRASKPDPWVLHRCIDCTHCDPLNLIGQTAICRWKRMQGVGVRETKIYDPYLFAHCNHFKQVVVSSEIGTLPAASPHQGEPQG